MINLFFSKWKNSSSIYFKYYIVILFIIFIIIIRYFNIVFPLTYIETIPPSDNFWKESSSNFNFNKELINNDDKILYLKNKTEFYLKLRKNFLRQHHVIYNESNLITFQDKLNWLVIHESPQYKSFLVDKIKLHDYSKRILGKDICVPLLKIYDNEKDIKFEELPDKFVLKLNHGSEMNIICEDKSKLDIIKVLRKLKYWKNINYGLLRTEFQYLYVNRKIFAEKFLSKDLIDYKIFCFNGEPKFIQIRKLLDLKKHIYLHNNYDTNWKLTDIESGLRGYIRVPNIKIKKPKNLKLMLKYAKLLSQEFVFIRVDFYEFKNQIYLGELTFTPTNSHVKWKNKKQNIYIANMMNLTRIKKYLFNK